MINSTLSLNYLLYTTPSFVFQVHCVKLPRSCSCLARIGTSKNGMWRIQILVKSNEGNKVEQRRPLLSQANKEPLGAICVLSPTKSKLKLLSFSYSCWTSSMFLLIGIKSAAHLLQSSARIQFIYLTKLWKVFLPAAIESCIYRLVRHISPYSFSFLYINDHLYYKGFTWSWTSLTLSTNKMLFNKSVLFCQ